MPIKFTATVRDLSHKGLGVIDFDGMTFFVRGTWPGDVAEFEVPENSEKYSEARLLKILKPSSDRIEIICKHRGPNPGECGGCPWMMASYSSQLRFKVKRLLHALSKRTVKVNEGVLKDICPSPQTTAYRNRVQLKTNGSQLGYVSENSSVFAPIESCLIMNNTVNNLFLGLKNKLPDENFKPAEGFQWNFIDLDDEMGLNDVVINKRRPFRQGNTAQNEAMKKWVEKSFDSIPRHFPVIDLFCGSGNFTEVLSRMGFTNILAVEVQGSALRSLEERKLPGVRILPLDITSKGSWALVAKHQPHAKAILIDPPREGLVKRRGFLKYLDNLKHIIYVSCELDTYSRDIADLTRNGWELNELMPVDLFPHTPHVEICSVLVKPSLSKV